jgi:hypothetical protein
VVGARESEPEWSEWSRLGIVVVTANELQRACGCGWIVSL